MYLVYGLVDEIPDCGQGLVKGTYIAHLDFAKK